MLTAEQMEIEAGAVARGITDLILAGITPDLSAQEKITTILSLSIQTFGDLNSGMDDDANRARFGLEVGAKVMDNLVSELLPRLTA